MIPQKETLLATLFKAKKYAKLFADASVQDMLREALDTRGNVESEMIDRLGLGKKSTKIMIAIAKKVRCNNFFGNFLLLKNPNTAYDDNIASAKFVITINLAGARIASHPGIIS